MTKERILTMCAIGSLAVVAAVGWMRRSDTAPESVVAAPASAYNTSGDNTPVADQPSYAYARSVRTVTQPSFESVQPGEPAPQAYSNRSGYADRGAYADRYAEPVDGSPRSHVVVKKRPFRRSAEIVGGSAGVGAAIGAIAGGGKGAGIGALSGGAAGFIYDRLTHKKRVVVTE